MIEFHDLSAAERHDFHSLVFLFRFNHRDHVENLIEEPGPSIAPPGSIMFKPEVWKPIHWRWFLELEH